jgi:hypothetical protein
VYFNEESEDNYILVLAYLNEDNIKMYFPFEANKFTGEFGRGAGQVFKDVRNVEFWINKYDKTYRTSIEVAKAMGNQVAKALKEELEFSNNKGSDLEGGNKEK